MDKDKEDKRRFFVVISAFIEVVMPAFQNLIERESKKFGSFKDFLNSKPILHTLFHLCFRTTNCCTNATSCLRRITFPIYREQWNTLFVENPSACKRQCHCKYTAKAIKLNNIDITLAATILRNCCILSKVEEDSVDKLRKYKNTFLSHHTKGTITENEFITLWCDIDDNIKIIDNTKRDDLDRIKRRPLDEALFHKYHIQWMDLQKSVLDVFLSVEKIAENQTQIAENQTQMNKNIKVMTQVILSGIPRDGDNRRPSIKHANLRFERHIDISTQLNQHVITAGLLRDDGLIILASSENNTIITFDMSGAGIDFIPVDYSPCDITATDTKTVAITLPEAKRIDVYEITTKSKKVRTINLSYCCFKITCIKYKLIMACSENILLFMDLIRNVSVTFETLVSADDSLSSSGDRIYHSNYLENTLTCYHDDGIKLYVVDLGEKPQGMTCILDNRLLVLMNDGKLRLVSKDGHNFKLLQYKDHKLKEPRIISYNHKLKKMFIANRHGFLNRYCLGDIL